MSIVFFRYMPRWIDCQILGRQKGAWSRALPHAFLLVLFYFCLPVFISKLAILKQCHSLHYIVLRFFECIQPLPPRLPFAPNPAASIRLWRFSACCCRIWCLIHIVIYFNIHKNILLFYLIQLIITLFWHSWTGGFCALTINANILPECLRGYT